MKKMIFLALTAVLCLPLLCGCSVSNGISSAITNYIYDNPDKYIAGGAAISDTVEKIDIDWIAGKIDIQPYDGDEVSFSEKADRDLDIDTSMYYCVEGTTLHIKFCRSGKWKLDDLDKTLTVSIPSSVRLSDLDVSTVSAEVKANDLQSSNIDIDTVSGHIQVNGCGTADRVELSSTSGKIALSCKKKISVLKTDSVSGTIEVSASEITRFIADTTSGRVSLTAQTAPDELEIDTVSGSVALNLPECTNATIEFDTVSGTFKCDLPCEVYGGGKYVLGDGSGIYDIDTTSGSVEVNQSGK